MSDAPSPAELRRRLDEDGFAGPFPLGTPAQMVLVGAHLLRNVFTHPGPSGDPFVDRHLDSPLVAQLCAHEAIRRRLEPVFGSELVVWRSLFFSKGPGSPEVPWHQDGHFWTIDPPITLTAWVAIDRAHLEDHCVEVIRGSHRTPLPHVASSAGALFSATTTAESFDASRAVALPMSAGMFILFDHRIVHRSRAGGEGRRLALSVRIAPAHVRFDPALLSSSRQVLSVSSGKPVAAAAVDDP